MSDQPIENPSSALANFDFNALASQLSGMGNTITTSTGQQVALPDNFEDIIPVNAYSTNDPIWTIVAGQARDERFYPGSDRFFALKSIKNDATGKWEKQYIGPLGDLVPSAQPDMTKPGYIPPTAIFSVFPLNYRFANIMFRPGDPTGRPAEERQPLCKSNNSIKPNAMFIHTNAAPSPDCQIITPQGFKRICPMLDWGKTKDPITGKSRPPLCTEQIYLMVAFLHEGAMQVGEIALQKGSIQDGRNIIAELRKQMKSLGQPVYLHPIQLTNKIAGKGNVPAARLLNTVTPEFSEDDHAAFQSAIQRTNEAKDYLARQATYIPRDSDNEPEFDDQAVITQTPHPLDKGSALEPATSPTKMKTKKTAAPAPTEDNEPMI